MDNFYASFYASYLDTSTAVGTDGYLKTDPGTGTLDAFSSIEATNSGEGLPRLAEQDSPPGLIELSARGPDIENMLETIIMDGCFAKAKVIDAELYDFMDLKRHEVELAPRLCGMFCALFRIKPPQSIDSFSMLLFHLIVYVGELDSSKWDLFYEHNRKLQKKHMMIQDWATASEISDFLLKKAEKI